MYLKSTWNGDERIMQKLSRYFPFYIMPQLTKN